MQFGQQPVWCFSFEVNMLLRSFAPSLLAICLSVACKAQEIELSEVEFNSLTKLGIVTLSAGREFDLSFPGAYMGDEVKGRVSLVNDTDADAGIEEITTSCGCTSALPVEKSVAAGKHSFLLLSYNAKGIGDSRIEIRFRFGHQDILLTGRAKTKSRFNQSVGFLTFDETARTEVTVKKYIPTLVESVSVFPPQLSVADFKDFPGHVSLTLRHPPNETPSDVTLEPIANGKTYAPIRYELRYPGRLDVLPRRLMANRELLRMFVRGDVGSLKGANEMEVSIDGKSETVACQITEVSAGTMMMIEFKNIFATGDHQVTIKVKDVSFSIPVTAR